MERTLLQLYIAVTHTHTHIIVCELYYTENILEQVCACVGGFKSLEKKNDIIIYIPGLDEEHGIPASKLETV